MDEKNTNEVNMNDKIEIKPYEPSLMSCVLDCICCPCK